MFGQPHDPTASLDLFILTFNAGKEQINPSVFAVHLRDAFAKGMVKDTDVLPEVIVICLQEMAPLERSFIGSYMINPYFQSWVTAVNLAALPLDTTSPHNDDYEAESPTDYPYTLMTTRNVGMTGILLFARDTGAIQNLKSTEVGFGAGDMANKGAVGLRMLFSKPDADGRKRQTELTFVGTHLAAHEWNLEKRNKNWESIVSGLLFENPKKLNGGKSVDPTLRTPESYDEREVLLPRDANVKALHDITIYKPGSHLFVAGDLNYRISKTSPTPKSVFPSLNAQDYNHFSHFLQLDQLMIEKAAGRTLHGLSESAISFPPTYKLKHMTEAQVKDHENYASPGPDVVYWGWARNRWPGWCDRVLYLDIPRWVSQSPSGADITIDTIAYDALPPVRTSDHRAVFLRLAVPVIEPSVLAPPEEEYTSKNIQDPRIKLPYPIDFESWDHRGRVKKWEWLIGWSMLVSQSKQGIAVFTALVFVGIGTWWLRSR
ncbi:Endonuclease/exonuclease/phosphatase [Xylaria bambusicola]|uniref:Endonuclease/exonuclease/phosphatase n=1 Tax=Xylaria bambusicola TaxID=326684 RepID=UPI002007F116|nr:Endonuclease/exonuclease/phosphatase [Xylaria bambusicola]KAI0522294.1 Endonuclease/exonuclease/phosphatase [Xylaria bambusicola]